MVHTVAVAIAKFAPLLKGFIPNVLKSKTLLKANLNVYA